jgi:glutaredoxin
MKHSTIAFVLGSLALLTTSGAQAQQVYRIVGADGKVSFSDKPPATAEQGKVTSTGVGAAGAASASGNLPFELRQVANKYPVTLYTSANCEPCTSGRNMLNARGVPFSERTVSTQEDIEQLQKIAGGNSIPLLTVGSQRIKGYSEGEWAQNLDAAGYPSKSMLPPSYKNPPASPLVALQKAPEPQKADTPEPAPSKPRVTRPAPPPPTVTPANPAGIRF